MHLLEQVAIFLLAAVLIVPVFQRLKLGAVSGYLASGMIIGPWGLGVIGAVESTLEFSEFGVVLLLFLIGLELEPRRLWTLRNAVFGLGGAQVLVTGALIAIIAMAAGLSWQAALITGLGGAMSSTALVMSLLAERGQLLTQYGRESFAILLFQDLAVIPLLALLPLLAAAPGGHGESQWMGAAKGVAVIVALIAGSRLLIRPSLKFIAHNRSREVFTAAALLLVIGTALIMQKIGLSMSLGAFLAGVLLADSEFRHELEADIEPFKGLLLGLFFMAVGMSANLTLIWSAPLALFGLALGMMLIKFLVMYAISRTSSAPDNAQRLAVSLAQGGEFALVLFAAATSLGIFDLPASQLLIMVVTVSMLLAPLVISAHEHMLTRWLERKSEPEYDVIDGPGNPVIIAGFGRVGQLVSRVLRMCGIPFTALEINYQQVDFVRRFGNKIYFGDASRLDLLLAAKIAEAKLFVLAIDDVAASLQTATLVREHFPDLPIVARARNRAHYFQLRDLGITMIYRETFLSSLSVAQQALLKMGFTARAAERAVALFKKHDEGLLEVQHAVHQDEAQLIQNSQQATEQLKSLFEADTLDLLRQDDKAETNAEKQIQKAH